jgi:ABC-2 type transport system permease protein
MRLVRVFGRLLAMVLTVTVQYRAQFVMLQIRNMIVPVVSLLVWRAAIVAGADLPVSTEFLATYFVLVSVVGMLTSSWIGVYLAERIRLGELALWLVRPASTHLEALVENVAEKLVKLAIISPMVAVFAFVLRDQTRFPTDGLRWLGFAASVVLAAGIAFSIDVLIGSLAFWFEEVAGFDRAKNLILPVLSGAVVPLALLPGWAATVVDVQPFRFVVSFPLEVLLADRVNLLAGFGLQLAWLAFFAATTTLVWRRGIRGYSAAGA